MLSNNRDDKTRSLPPGQKPIKQLLRWGKDHPTITSSIPKLDLAKWNLEIDGEIERPLKLSWKDLLELPATESISNFHCVEGWSVLNCRWEGVRFKHMIDVVKPKKTAAFVLFECADGYTTSLPLKELLSDDVLLAYKLDGKELEGSLGWPLRLVVPAKYAYKSAMWITKMRFMARKELGYWESRRYSDTADVWKNDRFATK